MLASKSQREPPCFKLAASRASPNSPKSSKASRPDCHKQRWRSCLSYEQLIAVMASAPTYRSG